MGRSGAYYMRLRYVYTVHEWETRYRKIPRGPMKIYRGWKDLSKALPQFQSQQNLYDFVRRHCARLTPLPPTVSAKRGNMYIQRVKMLVPVFIHRSRRLPRGDAVNELSNTVEEASVGSPDTQHPVVVPYNRL